MTIDTRIKTKIYNNTMDGMESFMKKYLPNHLCYVSFVTNQPINKKNSKKKSLKSNQLLVYLDNFAEYFSTLFSNLIPIYKREKSEDEVIVPEELNYLTKKEMINQKKNY